MNQEDGGNPHVQLGENPNPEERVDSVWVLVATTSDGGEGIYGHLIGDHMTNFVTCDSVIKQMLEDHIHRVGAVEVLRRQGTKLEWREFKPTGVAHPPE